MRGLFVDTSAWAAISDRRDEHHHTAREAWVSATRAGIPLYSTLSVFGESLTLIRRRAGHQTAVQFGRGFLGSRALQHINEDEALMQRAWDIFVQFDKLTLSYVDCTSFAAMERLALRQAFSFDADFLALGFLLFPASPLLG